MVADKSALANAMVVATTATIVSVAIGIMTSMAAAVVESSSFDSASLATGAGSPGPGLTNLIAPAPSPHRLNPRNFDGNLARFEWPDPA